MEANVLEGAMKKGDRVYAAGFDFGGRVVVDALTVRSAGAHVVVEEGRAALGYRQRVSGSRLGTSRAGALEQLVATVEAEERAALDTLAKARQRLADARAALDAERAADVEASDGKCR